MKDGFVYGGITVAGVFYPWAGSGKGCKNTETTVEAVFGISRYQLDKALDATVGLPFSQKVRFAQEHPSKRGHRQPRLSDLDCEKVDLNELARRAGLTRLGVEYRLKIGMSPAEDIVMPSRQRTLSPRWANWSVSRSPSIALGQESLVAASAILLAPACGARAVCAANTSLDVAAGSPRCGSGNTANAPNMTLRPDNIVLPILLIITVMNGIYTKI